MRVTIEHDLLFAIDLTREFALQVFRRELYRRQWILDLVSQAARHFTPGRLLLRLYQFGQIVDDYNLFLLLIGLAARANSDTQPPYEPERPCWSFDDACCIEEYGWDECCRWPVRPDDDQGLFDAEERFADDAPPPLRCR